MRTLIFVALATVAGCANIGRGGGMAPARAATDAKTDQANTGASTDSVATNGSDTSAAPTRL